MDTWRSVQIWRSCNRCKGSRIWRNRSSRRDLCWCIEWRTSWWRHSCNSWQTWHESNRSWVHRSVVWRTSFIRAEIQRADVLPYVWTLRSWPYQLWINGRLLCRTYSSEIKRTLPESWKIYHRCWANAIQWYSKPSERLGSCKSFWMWECNAYPWYMALGKS